MIRVFELFSGIGAIRKSLQNIHIDHQIVGISEIDKFAIQSYNYLYGLTPNYGDITSLDPTTLPDFDLLSYGFPCQDISQAGKQAGLDENSGTRSSLLWTAIDIIKIKRPKYLIMENVKNLIGPTHRENFLKYLNILQTLGYQSSFQVLNANGFNVPQNRERVICISILGSKPRNLINPPICNLTIRDIAEKDVPESYYMDKPFMPCESMKQLKSGLWLKGTLEMKATESIKRVYSKDGMCPTLTTMGGGHREPKILEDNGRVRKLTPRECWKLMGFTDADFNKVATLSNTQLYKQIGNSICVTMLDYVLDTLLL